MTRTSALVAMIVLAVVARPVPGQVENLRITELQPFFDPFPLVEVTNFGPVFTTQSSHPFCYRFRYAAAVPVGTRFDEGAPRVFFINNVNAEDSDFWLYTMFPFSDGRNMVHGFKYGPEPGVARTALAVEFGFWPSVDAYIPSPPAGTTIAWDGFGIDPKDWYLDATPSIGEADTTTPGTVPPTLVFPCGVQDFESVPLGDEVIAITGWTVVDTSATMGMFTVRAVNDVLGVDDARPASTSRRWLRIRDQDDTDVQNRFYSGTVVAPAEMSYAWTFFVNVEETPPGGAVRPRLTIQHEDGGFGDAWGIEFADDGARLVVTGIGGPEDAILLYPLKTPTGLGDWVKTVLTVDFDTNIVTASANDGTPVALPIDLSPTADPGAFRFCYRGEGVGNIGTMLLDDVTVRVGAALGCPADVDCNAAVDFGDILAVLAAWGPYAPCPPYVVEDTDRDCTVAFSDILMILSGWGPCE